MDRDEKNACINRKCQHAFSFFVHPFEASKDVCAKRFFEIFEHFQHQLFCFFIEESSDIHAASNKT